MRILSLDTSGKTQSVALLSDGLCLAMREQIAPPSHTEILLSAIEEILEETRLSLNQLDLLAGTHGPGSFTGLRIGLSTLKALSISTGIPVVGVGTLEALAEPFFGSHDWVAPCLDARMGEVYGAVFQRESGDTTVRVRPQACSAEEFRRMLSGLGVVPYLVGSGLETYPDLGGGDSQARVQAFWVGRLAERVYNQAGMGQGEILKPQYLRVSTAERNRMEGTQPFR